MLKRRKPEKQGWAITVDVVERLGESYYLVRDHERNSLNDDSITMTSLPAELDIQIGETLVLDGSYVHHKDISFINHTGIVHLNRCSDELSRLYAKEISSLSQDLKDYHFIIQVTKNEHTFDSHLYYCLDGYHWEMALHKETVLCMAPPKDLSPNVFLYAQSSQRDFFHRYIPKTSERLRWNAASMIAKAIVPIKRPTRIIIDQIAAWLVLRDKRYEIDENVKLVKFIESCRALENAYGNPEQTPLLLKSIRQKFADETYNGNQKELVDVLGLKETTSKPVALYNKCSRTYIDLKNNYIDAHKAKERFLSNAFDLLHSKDHKSSILAKQVHEFMSHTLTGQELDHTGRNLYKHYYSESFKEYHSYCSQANIEPRSYMNYFLTGPECDKINHFVHKKYDIIQAFKNTKQKLSHHKHDIRYETTLYSNQKWQLMPIQRCEILDNMTNSDLVESLMSQAKYIYGLISEYIQKNIFPAHERKDIRNEIVNLGALIAETQFGTDKETKKKREFYFHYKNSSIREDYIALLRSLNFFDKIFNHQVMIDFFSQLQQVLKAIFSKDSYQEVNLLEDKNIINL